VKSNQYTTVSTVRWRANSSTCSQYQNKQTQLARRRCCCIDYNCTPTAHGNAQWSASKSPRSPIL